MTRTPRIPQHDLHRVERAPRPLPSRRDMLRLLGGAGLLGVLPLGACDGMGALGTGDAGNTGADGPSSSDLASGGDLASSAGWASGGTAAMKDKGSYPDPFSAALGSCAIVAATTEGPCTTSTDLDRRDISDGLGGLPVRLAIKVVDSSCKAVAGATVKIWHTNAEGSYSGQTPNNNMCLKQQAYSAQSFFRGVQTTAADGTVLFDTCFPGWYRGRAVHIHFQVKSGNTSYRISQLFFPEDVTAAIFAGHVDYKSYGQPDTLFATDNIISGIPANSRDQHILTVARMSDGAMLASKAVAVV